MTQKQPLEAAAGKGLSFGDERTFPSRAESKNQQKYCPIILASQARMQSDLLAESLEFSIAYATGMLRAIREADYGAIIETFRFFDAVARCARRCAEELRKTVKAVDGGAP